MTDYEGPLMFGFCFSCQIVADLLATLEIGVFKHYWDRPFWVRGLWPVVFYELVRPVGWSGGLLAVNTVVLGVLIVVWKREP
jgi:hypothetical protein